MTLYLDSVGSLLIWRNKRPKNNQTEINSNCTNP